MKELQIKRPLIDEYKINCQICQINKIKLWELVLLEFNEHINPSTTGVNIDFCNVLELDLSN